MRLVQRRLLVKLDDKKAGTLEGVQVLFDRTQSQISSILRELEIIKTELDMSVEIISSNLKLSLIFINIIHFRSQSHVSCAFALFKMLVSCFEVPLKPRKAIEAVLVSPITNWMDQVLFKCILTFHEFSN